MSFRTALVVVNLAAIGGLLVFIAFRVFSLRRNPEPKAPENFTPFFDDDVLEGPHLERVLAVALVALVISVVGLVAYFMWEPFRSEALSDTFREQSIERGEILYAGPDSEVFNSAVSLNCARCHGATGAGGTATQLVRSTDPRCDPQQRVDEKLAEEQPYCLPSLVSWAAPSLQRAPQLYSRAQLSEIITYGRPGTPMPAWGVASGKGSLNRQGIQDLVNYIYSISPTTTQAQRRSDDEVAAMRQTLRDPEVRAAAATWVASTSATVAEIRAELDATPAGQVELRRRLEKTLRVAEEGAATALAWQRATESASEGEVLFMTNCARCHTRGWSYFDARDPLGNPPPGPMGGGAYGPNLRGGTVNEQFPSPLYDDDLFGWIAAGVPRNEQFGISGISSGRMPHFGSVLTKEQIEAIMDYERSL